MIISPHISSYRSRKDRRSRSRSRHRSRSHRREYRDEKDRSRHESERTHHDQVDGSKQRIRSPSSPAYSSSTSRESDFAKLTAVLSGIVSTGSKRSTYVDEKILPEFDPALKNFSASEWVQKVNMCGEMYDWDNKTMLYLAILKLKGNAKLWHDGLQNSLLTWEAFSLEIVRQFPGEESFRKLMEDAVIFKSTLGQDLQTYCFAKLGKIKTRTSRGKIS